METFNDFKIRILHTNDKSAWYYEIYTKEGMLVAIGYQYYPSAGIARCAAIGHIQLMETKNSESGRS